MESFVLNYVLPIVILIVLLFFIYTIVIMVLDIIRLNFVIVRIAAFFTAYYFAGEYIFKTIESKIMTESPELIKIIYMPIHFLINLFS